jgi:hypothetical protein
MPKPWRSCWIVAIPYRTRLGKVDAVLRSTAVEQSASLLLRWRPVELIQAQFLLLTFRDLSPDEQALIQQQRFMTDLTHELRTPLAIVNGNLQRLSRFKGLPSAARSRLAMAGEEVDRIRRLIEHLSLLTRLKVDPALLAFGEHDLLSLIKRWTEALEEPAIRSRWVGAIGDHSMHGGFGSQCSAVGFGSFVGQRPALWRWDQSNSASVAPIGPTELCSDFDQKPWSRCSRLGIDPEELAESVYSGKTSPRWPSG